MECKFIVGSKLDNIDPKELIDTLWNVNQPGKRDGVKWGRINRYIMECKYPI